MAILNFTGFEEGTNSNQGNGYHDTSPFAGTEASYDSTTKRTGSYAMKVAKVGTAVGSLAIPCAFGSDGRSDTNSGDFTDIYIQFYFRYSAKPASNSEEICEVIDTNGNPKSTIRLVSTGVLAIYDEETTLTATGSTVLSANTWYQIRFRVGSGASGARQLYIDGVSEINTTYSYATHAQKFNLGCRTNRNTVDYTVFFDDVVASDSAFPSGACEVKVIKPTANGSTMSWTNGTNSSNYLEVDEIPRDDGSVDYVTSVGSSAPQVALFAMQNCSDVGITGTILALKARIITRENSSNTSATLIRVKSSSTNSDSATLNGSTQLQGRQRLLETDPATSSAWTTGGIDAVEIGAVENNNVAVRLTNVMGYVLYIPSTSVDYPITAAQGSFTLTGQSALLKLGKKLLAVYGSFSLSGQTALLKFGRKMLAVFGSFTLSGQSTILKSARKIIADYGAITLTGVAAGLRIGKGILATYGTFNLTGQNAILTSTRKITAVYGAFVLSGQNVLLKIGKTITAVYGAFTLTGQSVNLKINKLLLAVYGAFTLTGQTALLSKGKLMIVSVGSFILSGQGVLLKLGRIMLAIYETFTITGQSALLKLGKGIIASYGAFVLTGQSVLFRIAVSMQAVYGQFTLTGQIVRFALNGLYIRWNNAVKNTATYQNIAKNVASWINRNKNL